MALGTEDSASAHNNSIMNAFYNGGARTATIFYQIFLWNLKK
jgi:hypothetical protein